MTLLMKGSVLTVLVALAVVTSGDGVSGGKEAFFRAIDSVHASCDSDVSRLCAPVTPSSPHILLARGSSGLNDDDGMDDMMRMIDSMLSWNPLETESSFDSFVESALGQILSPPLPVAAAVPMAQEQEAAAVHDLKPSVAFEYLAEVGNNMMKKESEDTPPNRRRLARRLTALSSESADDVNVDNMDLKPRLGYGCYIDSCLWSGNDQGALSTSCAVAMDVARLTFPLAASFHEEEEHDSVSELKEELKSARSSMTRDMLENYEEDIDEEEEEEEMMLNMMTLFSLYLLLLPFTALFFYHFARNRQHRHRQSHGNQRQLRRAILTAVYQNQDIKDKVQQAVGEEYELGDEPPCGPQCGSQGQCPHSIRDSSQPHWCVRIMDRFFFSLPLLSLAALLMYTSIESPSVVILIGGPAIILMMVYVLLKDTTKCCVSLCCTSNNEEVDSDFEMNASEPLLATNPGNDTGKCHNCDVASMSCCGSCGCCVNCCACAYDNDNLDTVHGDSGSPYIVML